MVILIPTNSRFPLGQIVMTPTAQEALSPEDIAEALPRHASGDWGQVCDEDRQENELSLEEGFRLFSVYVAKYSSKPTKFWIITEADRSVTTILLPKDY